MTHIRPFRRRLPVVVGIVLLTALGLTAAPAQAFGEIAGAGAPNAVPNSYLVELKDSAVAAKAVPSAAGSLANRFGATVTHTYQHAIRGFAATMSESDAKKLAADPAVLRVAQNTYGRYDTTQFNPPSYGLDRIDQRVRPLLGNYTYPNTAAGVVAYVIDSGVRNTHQDFGGRAFLGANTVPGAHFDCVGHGTHVAGTVGGAGYGVAKGVTIVAVKVGACSPSLIAADVIEGVDWVTAHHTGGPAVANMSLGFSPPIQMLDNAVNNSIADGITYVVSSGNNSTDACAFSPARVAAAITVNATDANDVRAGFSNFGACTDIFAPGVSITSAGNASDVAGAVMSGTSMAAPHVTGAAALVLAQNPAATPAQVAAYLYATATPNLVASGGANSPNRLLFVQQPAPPAAAPGTDRLVRGEALAPNQIKVSQNGAYVLAMQGDGNLVLYSGGTPLWHTSTFGHPGAFAYFQGDGNFVVYSAAGVPLRHICTYGTAANMLLVQNDSNLVMFGPSGEVYWTRGIPPCA